MTAGGRAVVFAALVAVALAVTGPAWAEPILEQADAVELANKLAEATAEQGICYGWDVAVIDENGRDTGEDVGSSLGPGRELTTSECPRFVVFRAVLHYTSNASEAQDTADFDIHSNVTGAPDAGALRRFGVTTDALLGDRDDQTVLNAVAALPALVAEAGLAPPVALEEPTGTIPASDRPTGGGGSDRLRTYGALYALTAALVLGGLGWIGAALYLRSTHSSD